MGHGGSSDPPCATGGPADYPFSDLVPELVELVDAVYAEFKIPKEKKFFVVGHSQGACCAIEVAACPAVKDRVAAIAPVSGPCDIWNDALSKKDRAFMYGIMKHAENNTTWCSCCLLGGGGWFGRWALKKMAEGCIRPVQVAGDGKTYTQWKDGLAELFKSYCGGEEGGDKRAWDVVYVDTFIVSQILDAHIPGPHNAEVWTTDMRRGNSAPWSYDPQGITAPCFIYMGDKEETPIGCGLVNQKLIHGSELILWEGYGHCSIFAEHRRIIQALVQKKKVEGPPLWEQGQEAAKLAQKK